MPRSARTTTLPTIMRLGALLCVTAVLGPLTERAAADAVTDWNARAGAAAVAACISPADDPIHESRLYAMVHVAIHDAPMRSTGAPGRTRTTPRRTQPHPLMLPSLRQHAMCWWS